MNNDINKIIQTMIVEDNHEARQLLIQYLSAFPEIKILAVATTIEEATQQYREYRPSLLFLDIELGAHTGFEFLQNIRYTNNDPTVIFITAFDHYAIKAIKYSAFDYLLKPLDPEELNCTISRYLCSISSVGFRSKVENLLLANSENNPIKLNKKNGFVLVRPVEILYCKADWNYTEVFMKDHSSHMVTVNLGQMEALLPRTSFLRANRSLILNINFLHQVHKTKKVCILKTGQDEIALPMTTSRIRKLENLLDSKLK